MPSYRIAVLGAGNIGRTLGRKWAAVGHTVAFGVVHPDGEKAGAVREELGERATVGTTEEALDGADVVLLAVPGAAVDELARTQAARLDGRVIVDATNRMGGGGPMNSLAVIQTRAPKARVYRAFNSVGWENFADPVFDGVAADLFYCGPEGEARDMVERLIADVGLRPMYVGGPERAEVVDGVASLWFALALGQRRGRHLAFKVLAR